MMYQGDLLWAVLSHLDRGDTPDSRWPDAKGEYWALCPFHPDTHATNFSVSERGYKCFACGAKGGLRGLAERLGVTTTPQDDGLTIARYAQAKKLPLDFLHGLGVRVDLARGYAVGADGYRMSTARLPMVDHVPALTLHTPRYRRHPF